MPRTGLPLANPNCAIPPHLNICNRYGKSGTNLPFAIAAKFAIQPTSKTINVTKMGLSQQHQQHHLNEKLREIRENSTVKMKNVKKIVNQKAANSRPPPLL